jgi:hypothetical protein
MEQGRWPAVLPALAVRSRGGLVGAGLKVSSIRARVANAKVPDPWVRDAHFLFGEHRL